MKILVSKKHLMYASLPLSMAGEDELGEGGIISGLFLFFFGLPFTLVPVLLIPVAVTQIDDLFPSLFMMAFSIPFLMAGIGVQFSGIKMIRGALLPKAPAHSYNEPLQTSNYANLSGDEPRNGTTDIAENDESEKSNFWDSV